jgi:hypothetical protein
MATFWGLALIALSIIILIMGDKKVISNEGKVSRIFGLNSTQAKLVKWACALVAFCFGIAILLSS